MHPQAINDHELVSGYVKPGLVGYSILYLPNYSVTFIAQMIYIHHQNISIVYGENYQQFKLVQKGASHIQINQL